MRWAWAIAIVVCGAVASSGVPILSVLAAYILMCYLPGRVVIDLCGIARGWDRSARGALSLAFSLAITPVLLNPIWHVTNERGWVIGAFALAVFALGLAVARLAAAFSGSACDAPDAERTAPLRSGLGFGSLREPASGTEARTLRAASDCEVRLHETWRSWLVAKAILLVILLGCVGTYFPNDLGGGPVPSLVHDYIKHHAVLLEMQSHALPLGNPFFASAAGEPVYYYHFFYLIPATIRAVAPDVPISLAFGLQSTLVAISVAAMAYLLAKRVYGGEGPALLAAMLATIVGGLDIIPLIIKQMPAITLDAWADTLVRIHALLTQMVWTPQNVSGILILLVAAFVLSSRGLWRGWLILGPILGASLIGSTVWVAAAVLPALFLLVLTKVGEGTKARRHEGTEANGGDSLREPASGTEAQSLPPASGASSVQNPIPAGRDKIQNRLVGAAAVAALTLLLFLPSLLGYMETSRRHGKGLTTEWPHQENALLGQFAPPGVLANLLDLPWVLAIELGALAIFPLLRPRAIFSRAWNDTGMRLILLSAVVSLAAFVTVRSFFTYNDFGQKVIFAAMIAGVLLAAGVVEPSLRRPTLLNPLGFALPGEWSRARRLAISTLMTLIIVASLPVSLFQTPVAAIRRFVPDAGPLARVSSPIARQAAREGGGLCFLRDQTPHDAIVQAHWDAPRIELMQMVDRRVGVLVLQEDTHVFQGRSAAMQEHAVASLKTAVERGDAAMLHSVLRGLAVTHVFIGETEQVQWTRLDRFADERFFDTVFDDGTCRVIAVRHDHAATQQADR
ncbi:MAG: hypothetical protein ACKVS9_01920 [Phycisphaerae bacterium]